MIDALERAAPASDSTAAAATLSENYDMFLVMLTEQLRNQDPLNPTDATEFTNQLVQFSNVEQQILQNQNLEQLIESQNISLITAASSLVGQEAALNGPTASLADGRAVWRYDAPPETTELVVTIRDENDQRVRTTSVSRETGGADFVWDGRDDNGDLLADGVYSASFSAVDQNSDPVSVAVAGVHVIDGLDFSDGVSPGLIAGGDIRQMSDIRRYIGRDF